ncbi:MAG: hypothetical protein ACI83O_000711 [Patescibacteria group bacterium]|jgi:hypothetical protein
MKKGDKDKPKEDRTNPKALGAYLGANYSAIQGLIKQADTKANIVIGLTGFILSMFFTTFKATDALPIWQITIVLGVLLLGGFFALSTLYPRMAKPSGNFSLTYYRDAMDVDVNKWSKKFLSSDCEALIVKDTITNIKEISKIAHKKYSRLRWSYILLAVGVTLKLSFEYWAGILI